MGFLDRFIKFPIKVYDAKEAELLGEAQEYRDSWVKINPMEISHYRPNTDEETGGDVVSVFLRNGGDYLIHLTIEEFEKLLSKI